MGRWGGAEIFQKKKNILNTARTDNQMSPDVIKLKRKYRRGERTTPSRLLGALPTVVSSCTDGEDAGTRTAASRCVEGGSAEGLQQTAAQVRRQNRAE